MAKIKDVAEAANVSTATVSRVLSGKTKVSPAVEKRVNDAVRELGYRPNRVARNLRSSRSQIIGLIVSDIENVFFQQVSRAVEDAALELGYSVVLCNSDEDPAKEMMYLQLLSDENVAGIVLSPTRKATEDFSAINSLNIPMVVIDRRVSDYSVDNIVVDNVEAAYTAVSHLLAQGRRCIAGVFGEGSSTGIERRDGYLRALQEHGLADPSLIRFVKAKEEDGLGATKQLLQSCPNVDAVFTSNSLLAAGVLRAANESGLSVPGDVAVVSFDETRWARLIVPALTVVEQPTYEIGRTAAGLLVKRINDPARATREVVLSTRLIVRQSCGAEQK